jgi:hypothetical protein
MKLVKTYNPRTLVPVRSKPYVASNDHLDAINDEFAEHERWAHARGECGGPDDHCPHCEADKQAELEARHYERHVFERIHDAFSQFRRIR